MKVQRNLVLMSVFCMMALTACGQELTVEKTDRVGRIVENEYFIADMSSRVIRGATEDSGNIRALTYKPFDLTMFRTGNRMHWAPNIQRVGAPDYQSIGVWDPVQEFREEQRDDVYIHHREGYLPDYPEVRLEAEYRFFPNAPYFWFWSRMTVEKPLTVMRLRNNEMTMDPVFTHMAWPAADGENRVVTFEERVPMLEANPIDPGAPWMVFLNPEKGYGYGFVNLGWQASKTANASIGVADGDGGARYWQRFLIIDDEVTIEPGDVFEETTVFVLFRTSEQDPLGEFLAREAEIRERFGVE